MRYRIVLLLALVLPAAAAQAGPNAGGVLLLHANTSITYTSEFTDYCGQSGLAACPLAVTSVPWDPDTTTVFYVMAAFADTAQPRLKALSFGIDWDPENLYIAAHGSCADFDLPDNAWPDPGTGIGLSWTEARTDSLVEVYWFAAYAYAVGDGPDTMSVALIPHPVQGAVMVDDAVPPNEDEIAAFGRLGFGTVGTAPCPVGGSGDDSEGGEEPDEGGTVELDSDENGDLMWERDCILIWLRGDLPMPSRQPVDELGIAGFDSLGRELGLVSLRRLLTLDDATCSRYPGINRMAVLRFGSNTDEREAARWYAELPEVIIAQPNYAAPVVGLSAYANDPGFARQWHLMGPGATSCRDVELDPECCIGCDLGVDVAWQYARGDSGVLVAFIDTGADMQHPDLIDAYAFNPLEDANDNGRPDLCPADPDGGDMDSVDADGNGVVDDVLLGWSLQNSVPTWKHKRDWHGTSVAGLLAAVSNNGTGVASVAGGDDSLQAPGVRLIQFSARGQLTTDFQIQTFVYAHEYGARVYSSSLSGLLYDEAVGAVVDSLSDDMMFFQSAGNQGSPSIVGFAALPGVITVGGYDGITGGRWEIPGEYQEVEGFVGSSYGPELEIMGPSADPLNPGPYLRMVMASTDRTHNLNASYECDPSAPDSVSCFGGTSAATPIVASVAALLFSYSEEHHLGLSPDHVRKILTHTAEDIRCDPLLIECDCSDTTECVDLLGRDDYSGFGRVDAGRALTLPVAILDALSSPVFAPEDTIQLQWEAFGSVVQGGELGSGAHFELHYLVPDSTVDWREIDEQIEASARSYDWVVPENAPAGYNRRIRLTVVDSLGHRNADYSGRFRVLDEPGAVESASSSAVIQSVSPNPSARGARIRYLLRSSTNVRVDIYDVAGRRVRALVKERQLAGPQAVDWDGRDGFGNRVPSGMYFVRLYLGSEARSVRLVRIG